MAALLTCASLAAWGQEKMKFPVYINEWGDVKIEAPDSVGEGEDLYFTVEPRQERGFWCFNDGNSSSAPLVDGKHCLSNVTGPVLLCVSEYAKYTIDGVTYNIGIESIAYYAEADQPKTSSVELKSIIQIDGIYYDVLSYNGCFNQYENIESIVFPSSPMIFYSNTINKQVGLKEIHAKLLDPTKYQGIEDAFGEKDLSGVTLYVPKGCTEIYKQSAPWNRFGEIVEEGEVQTVFPVYVVGPGIESYTPTSIKKGERLWVDVIFEDGYYSSGYSLGGTDPVDCDRIVNFFTTNRVSEQNGITYSLEDRSTAGVVKANLSKDIEELVIPAYITSDEGYTYQVAAVWDDTFANLSHLKKLTIEGNTGILDIAFSGCISLEEIHCKGKNPSIGTFSTAFDEIIKNKCIVYVPKGCVDTYRSIDAWNGFANIVEEGTVVNTNSVKIVNNPFDSSYLQASGLNANPSEASFIYQVEEDAADSDVLVRYTIRNYDQWKDHVAIYYWEDMSTAGSGLEWTPASISPEGVFEINVSKDYIAKNGQDMFYNNLRVYADQTGELTYDIQAYLGNMLALDAKDNVMAFVDPVSFTCGLDTIKGSVGKKIEVPITVGEVSSAFAGREFRVYADFWLPVDGKGKFHVYRPDGEEVNLVQTGSAGDPVQRIIMSDKDGILMGEMASNQTYTLTIVSDIEIPDEVNYMVSFYPMVDGKRINSADWLTDLIITPAKVIEDDETVTDTEVDKITIESKQETQITVNLDGVTSGEVTVSTESDVKLELSGDNDLGDLLNSGNLVISTTTTTNVTLNYNTITNEGTLTDETGLVTSVEGSAALSIEPIADATVQEGGTVTLTATANVEVNVTVTFQWQRLVDGVWQNVGEPIVQGGTITRAASDANGTTADLKVQSADAGEYRCLISRTEPVESTDDKEVSTTLTAYATVTVTEPVEPEPEPDPEPSYYDVTLPVVEGATIEAVGSTSVEAGDSFSFIVTVKEGYVATNMVVKANGVTLTPNADGRYTIANVRSNVVVTVTGIEEDPATAIESVDASELKVWSSEGRLHIRTPRADRAYIVTFGGRVYKIQELPAGETAIPMPQGAYIIYVGGESFKISM